MMPQGERREPRAFHKKYEGIGNHTAPHTCPFASRPLASNTALLQRSPRRYHSAPVDGSPDQVRRETAARRRKNTDHGFEAPQRISHSKRALDDGIRAL